MSDHSEKRSINIFKPLAGPMRGEVMVIASLLVACLLAVLGTQAVIWHLETTIQEYRLTDLIFFNLPIHFWVSGQFLPLLFILLCLLFNLWMDSHEVRRMESTIRFRATGRKKGEVP